MATQVLIIDDNARVCQSLSKNLEYYGYQSIIAHNASEAIGLYSSRKVEVVLLDVILGDASGLDVLARLKSINDRVPIIVITGFASIETAVQAIKVGAFDYLQKPIDLNKLMKTMDNAIRLAELSAENRELKHRLDEFAGKLVTSSPKMVKLCEMAQKIASTDMPVLILGENGTGKEVLADFIHYRSGRRSKPLHKVNCASFPDSLLDNELFGHERGAYTGAESVFKGVFERAEGGTLFLDEIGDMGLSIQAKILRTIQNREIRRIGGAENVTIDVRFIAATNKDLEALIERGDFREDLYYRLNIASLWVPPLRERREDILALAAFFLAEIGKERGEAPPALAEDVEDFLLRYAWPGNIRELKNTLSYASALASTGRITLDCLPATLMNRMGNVEEGIRGELNIRETVERNLIVSTLKAAANNKSETAKTLGMSRKTLYEKLRRYGIPISR
jgi:DNA-binding NtrC family response regulator